MKNILFILIFWGIPHASQAQKKPVDYVNVFTGTSNSRWMLFPGATLPFGMVKLSPDNQDNVWNGGYEYTIGSISGFSHLHAMSLSGVSMMPMTGKIELYPGQPKTFEGKADGPFGTMWTSGFRSRYEKSSEKATPGYYAVHLLDHKVTAELTATLRTGWLRFTFPASQEAHILYDFDFPTEEKTEIVAVSATVLNNNEIRGFIRQKNQYADEFTVYFVSQFSKPFLKANTWQTSNYKGKEANYGTFWRDHQAISTGITQLNSGGDCGIYLDFQTLQDESITVKTGISFVSIDNAKLNLDTETKAFGWDFDRVRKEAATTWNDLLSTVTVEDKNEDHKTKFYTCLYRSYAGKSIMSDVNGQYTDMHEQTRQLPSPNQVIYSADSFWGTQWNNTPLWTLLTPQVARSWIGSMLAMYDAGGWIADAPTGFEYAPIMDAQHHTALIVSSYMKGIRDFDTEKAWQAIHHDLTTPDTILASGGHAGSRSLKAYLRYGYVPDEDGPTSNTLEYAYDDWTAAQFAKRLGKTAEAAYFLKRSENYKNTFDPDTRYMRRKHRNGQFVKDFDPFFFGCINGWNGSGYMEGNAWLYTFFVPHNVPDLIQMIGKDTFNTRLEQGFAKEWVDMGNQPNMQAPFLFNYSGKPWLTQQYSRYVLDHFYDTSPYKGWQGEEDEGQLSSLFVLMAMGLFEMDGGCSPEPYYDLSSPLFKKVTIRLDHTYYGGKTFTIETQNNSAQNIYIQSVSLNGKPLTKPILYHKDLVKGGKLVVRMGSRPNLNWGR
jgi:predicted alpha-1,2-mannosidase